MSDDDLVRHSKAKSVEIISDPDERARREAFNALVQTDRVNSYILDAISGQRPFRLRASIILDLNRCAVDGIETYAGNYRPGEIEIGKSSHVPPPPYLVPGMVEDLCDYINDQWQSKSSTHLAAYSLWRMNWIHPFTDGNGRTARAVSYLVLCAHAKIFMPGARTIPDQIIDARSEYYSALEDADKKWKERDCPVEVCFQLESMLKDMLATQITSSYSLATGDEEDG
ncbi:MAG: Fic family protein [Geminicoccaceae bacterium]|nr:MAG: Fic family protein [Geminicoccaceae bacterium]